MVGFPHKPAITRVDFSERGSAAWLADEVIENVDVGWRVGDIKGMAQRVGQTCKVKEHGDGAAGMFGEAERVANKRIGKATAEAFVPPQFVAFKEAVAFLILFLVLIVRPQGILGRTTQVKV